jgi:NAD(P)-dependent dehydrogenase (short-subunit alcohol dehydrogenase family)
MASPQPSYTKVTHSTTYPAINPTLSALSSAGKVVVITGATGGIGRAAALSFAASGPKALVLLGRREDALAETVELVRSSRDSLVVESHTVDLVDDSNKLRQIFADVAATHGAVEVVIHAAGVLAPVVPLVEANPATFLDGYKTTVVGTLALAQALVLGNGEGKEATLVNLTTAGIFFPPFPGMGAYVSSKMAAVKLLQAFGAENPHVRIHHVHPGFLDTAMSAQLSKTTKLPFGFDDSKPCSFSFWHPLTSADLSFSPVSLPADFLVWVVSPEAKFLNGKVVFAAWDVDELKSREEEIVGTSPLTGELWVSYSGFPRYVGGHALGRR